MACGRFGELDCSAASAAYKAALPEAIKFVKDNGGEYLAGGFNKTKLSERDSCRHDKE